jgi:hypothetical protein
MLIPLISAISAMFGAVLATLVNFYLHKKEAEAATEKTKAETEKLRAETRLIERNLRVELERVEVKQTEQGQETRMLRFSIANFLNRFELMHLEGLQKDGPYNFDGVPWTFEQELVHLRSLGFIQHFEGKGIVAMKQEGRGDLKQHFFITNYGEEYLKFRQEMVGEAKAGEASASKA